MISFLIALSLALSPENPAPGECPAGQALVPGSLVMKTLPNGDTEGTWECKLAQKQLSDMGLGRVDTGTGFDGGIGPSSAVAVAALKEAVPGLTPEKIERYSKSAVFNEGVAELSRAAEAAHEAESRINALKKKQESLSDSLERQKLQIEIAAEERARSAARGAERIAAESVKRATLRMDVIDIMRK